MFRLVLIFSLLGLVLAQRGKSVAGFGRFAIGGTYGPHLVGGSIRLPLGASEYTFVEVSGGVGKSKAPNLTGLQSGAYVVSVGMNQGLLGGWLTQDCGIYWFLPYLDMGARGYYYNRLRQPDGRGGWQEKSVFVPDLFAGIGTMFNPVQHFELFGSVRIRAEILDEFVPTFSWQVGARISFGY
ncbi:MAG: hypothetical protein NZ580_02175 [Bacteroidia bacterium]|nr:hypothetical protein [Bacteroidia bacterium]MDW8235777.1 hypothetical protein [Bacteroidia bacterium]